ncbi:hypothetical protein BCR34DRAFT_586408 [Clohesyomyces aquaticus]|uniref:Uncharacterized protein n=1 Tax=Clohesyomyces aquaticus TaxID=1231657 RepID=A0A1Y1ZTQ5_9PLEO|nr:hypothetical protein BCR34DRAFT_586408 [Clohesyomyces aquaticus]
MQLTSTLLTTLAIAGGLSAAPAPAYMDVRATEAAFWLVSGWGNPNCQGSFLWSYTGTQSACVNVPSFAASVSYSFNQNTRFELRATPNCGISRRNEAVEAGLVEVKNVATPSQGCINFGTWAFKVDPL